MNYIRSHKIIFVILIATFITLGYVHQQVLVYQMGLKVKENYRVYSNLVDHNRIMVYNILNLKSPVSLEAKLLAKKVELNMPRKWHIVRLKNSPDNVIHKSDVKSGLFASLFTMGREAEASPNINGFSSGRR
jgi:hypothetical protein